MFRKNKKIPQPISGGGILVLAVCLSIAVDWGVLLLTNCINSQSNPLRVRGILFCAVFDPSLHGSVQKPHFDFEAV